MIWKKLMLIKEYIPRFWLMDRRQRTTSNGLVRSTRHWCCHYGPKYANACCRSNPTTKLWCLCHLKCTMNRLVKRWRCSSSRCVLCGWPLACSWPNSRPWRYDPSRLTRWLGLSGLVRNAHMTPSQSGLHLGWCICIRPKCSTIWWFCHVSRTRFDGCQRWMQPTRHPIWDWSTWKLQISIPNENVFLLVYLEGKNPVLGSSLTTLTYAYCIQLLHWVSNRIVVHFVDKFCHSEEMAYKK